MAKAGFDAVVWRGVGVIGSAIVLSPADRPARGPDPAVSWLALRATPFAVDRRFRLLQFVSSSLLSLAHGGNGAQKTMGVIAVLLISQKRRSGNFHVPMQGPCAETGGAAALFGAIWLGVPVSTTLTINGSIIGVGFARRASAVRWE